MTEKEYFVNMLGREQATLMRLLKEYPAAKAEYRPADKSRTAKDLAWTFAREQGVSHDIATKGKIEFDKMPPAPATWDEVLSGLEKMSASAVDCVKKMTDQEWNAEMDFFTGPGQMGKFRRADVLWFMLYDLIHHRGQFTVYNRLVGAKVPSIYGPSADEPWM